ncbi:MAG: GGDEF domain-containing protein [Sulfuricurvum sp.]
MIFTNLKTFLVLSFAGVVYYLIATLGMSLFSLHPSNITILWLPFGIGVILVHKYGIKSLPFIFLGSFFSNYSGMVNGEANYLLYVTISALADTLAPYISTLLIKRYVEVNYHYVKVLVPFAFYGALIPTFISGVIISLNLAIGGYISMSEVYRFIPILMFADSLGLFLLFPIYKHFDTLSMPTLKEWKHIAFYGISTSILMCCSFYYHYLIFLVLPILLIASFKIRMSVIMIMLFVIVTEMIVMSAHNNDLFTNQRGIESIVMLMTYLISLVFVVIGMSLHNAELIANIQLAHTDNLTQTKNVKAYKNEINKLISLYQRHQTVFSIILLDIDDFKSINDNYGHRVGDIVLTDMCSLIQKNIRTNDTLFRVGGEEFVILLPVTFLSEAKDVADKLKTIIVNDLTTIENRQITVSIGVTEVHSEDTEDSMYRRVDELLYRSKHNGKNMVTSQ